MYEVIKTLSLLSLVCALAIGGWMWTRQSLQTTDRAPAAILQAAATALEFSHRTNGTYAGATPEAVTLVSGDQFRYCIEYGGQFLAGPGGVPTPGACPRQ
jgi:2-keto-3-deoxy-6-phosphogluconate aldolase